MDLNLKSQTTRSILLSSQDEFEQVIYPPSVTNADFSGLLQDPSPPRLILQPSTSHNPGYSVINPKTTNRQDRQDRQDTKPIGIHDPRESASSGVDWHVITKLLPGKLHWFRNLLFINFMFLDQLLLFLFMQVMKWNQENGIKVFH